MLERYRADRNRDPLFQLFLFFRRGLRIVRSPFLQPFLGEPAREMLVIDFHMRVLLFC